MNKLKLKIIICGIILLFSNTLVVTSINATTIDTSLKSMYSISQSSVPSSWTIIAEDIAVEWDDTTVDDTLKESIYSKSVGDWVWTNPITLEEITLDEIEVRRLVRTDISEYHDAILILPMMYTGANSKFHWRDIYYGDQLNNPEDMFVYQYVEAGFDVYCLSTRDHNIPTEMYWLDVYSINEGIINWGARQYLDDIDRAVDLVKYVSGFDKIYLNTQEIGTALGMMYAVEHEENLKGIIAISGGTGGRLDKDPFIPDQLEASGVDIKCLTETYEFIYEEGAWLAVGSALIPFIHDYYYDAFFNPESEDIVNTPFGDISWFEFFGIFTNYFGTGDETWYYEFLDYLGVPHPASSKVEAMSYYLTIFLQLTILDPGFSLEVHDWLGLINTFHVVYPWKVLIDIQHMNQVEESSELIALYGIDWDEHFDEIDIPILTFVDTLAVNWWDQADYSDDTRTPDNIVYIMENMGALDLILSPVRDDLIVDLSIQWIFDRESAQHVSVGEIYIDGETIKAVMFLHEDYINVYMIYEREYINLEVNYYNDDAPNEIIWEATNDYYGDIYGGIYADGQVEFSGEEFVFSGIKVKSFNDVTKPVIDIISPGDGLITNQDVVLTYTVSDDVSAPEDVVITGPASGTTYTSEGYYHEIITATDEAGNTATASVSFIIDKTAPIGSININDGDIWTTSTSVTLTLTYSDALSGIERVRYSNDGIFWTIWETPSTSRPWALTSGDGVKIVYFQVRDHAGSTFQDSDTIGLDTTPLESSIRFDPPYFEINDKIHLTLTTPIELISEEIQGGSGLYKTHFKIFNDTYDSGLILYTDIFTLDYLGLYDGCYDLEYYSIDKAGNSEDAKSIQIVLDNSAPELSWEYEGYALQDGFTFNIEAIDATEVISVMLSIRELDGPIVAQIPLFYIGENRWEADESFDTTALPDGYYELLISASDKFGFTTEEVFDFSIRNWAVFVLLPSTESNKAGRTIPVKFALRVIEAVDPTMPFVVNQELDIYITDTTTGEILQHSTYGDGSTDYRINELSEQYITNFKTHKTPTAYLVSIYRRDFYIGDFTFSTVK